MHDGSRQIDMLPGLGVLMVRRAVRSMLTCTYKDWHVTVMLTSHSCSYDKHFRIPRLPSLIAQCLTGFALSSRRIRRGLKESEEQGPKGECNGNKLMNVNEHERTNEYEVCDW
jgi:hypothetical protein